MPIRVLELTGGIDFLRRDVQFAILGYCDGEEDAISDGGDDGRNQIVIASIRRDSVAIAQGLLRDGDFVISLNGLPVAKAPDLRVALAAAEGRATNVIEVLRSEVEPSELSFARYCQTYETSRDDFYLQLTHRHVGGRLYARDIGSTLGIHASTPLSDEDMRAVAYVHNVLTCDGCPQCLFGQPRGLLSDEQVVDPKVVRWALRPTWLREQPPMPPAPNKLRFGIGERVLVRESDEEDAIWAPATIASLRYRRPYWPAKCCLPYSIRCDSTPEVVMWCFDDTDATIRKMDDRKHSVYELYSEEF